MTKTAADYPVTFPYGAITPPYSKANPHSGEDRAMLMHTPIVVGDTCIGLSGGAKGSPGAGKSTGPHLHIQKAVGGKAQHPYGAGLGNSLAWPAVVTETGQNSEIGNFIRLTDANGVRWSYFHLSEIVVKEGQLIRKMEESVKPTHKQVLDLWREFDMGTLQPKQQEYYVKQPIDVLYKDIAYSRRDAVREFKQKLKAAETALDALKEVLNK